MPVPCKQTEAHGPQDEDESLELEDHVSQHLICPISHRIMDMPMVSPSGHTYDQASMHSWLSHRSVDPLSLTALRASSLYPNRALQSELLEQLQRLSESENSSLAAAAKAKLDEVRQVQGKWASKAESGEEADHFDFLIGRLASLSTWLGMLAWEQVLVFLTSFGAVLCLSIDTIDSIRSRSGGAQVRPPLLSTFVKIATWPLLETPRHWQPFGFGRIIVAMLRSALLLPVGSMFITVALGGLVSFFRFAYKCLEARAYETERMARHTGFMNIIQKFSGIVGFTSFGLFMRLWYDRRSGLPLLPSSKLPI